MGVNWHRSRQTPISDLGVRRDKAALSSGCKSHPATAPAGSNRSSHGGNKMAEAFGILVHKSLIKKMADAQYRSHHLAWNSRFRSRPLRCRLFLRPQPCPGSIAVSLPGSAIFVVAGSLDYAPVTHGYGGIDQIAAQRAASTARALRTTRIGAAAVRQAWARPALSSRRSTTRPSSLSQR